MARVGGGGSGGRLGGPPAGRGERPRTDGSASGGRAGARSSTRAARNGGRRRQRTTADLVGDHPAAGRRPSRRRRRGPQLPRRRQRASVGDLAGDSTPASESSSTSTTSTSHVRFRSCSREGAGEGVSSGGDGGKGAGGGDEGIREFRWSELKNATKSFSNSNIIALGGSFIIYKGQLKGGYIVTIKRCYSGYYSQWPHKNYDLLLAVSKLQHENIVKFVGYCYQVLSTSKRLDVFPFSKELFKRKKDRPRETEFLWVEEYMANGTLQDIIHDSRLRWSSLFQIIHRIAQGLHYLHEQHVVHMDVKPLNVILDYDMTPKITDFELSIVLPDNEIIIHESVMGTMGYIDPEYMVEGIVSTKNDVYGFGITLLETVGSMCRPKPPRRDWKALKAQLMKEEFAPARFEASELKQIRRCIQIGLLCTEHDRRRRPNMNQVVAMLNGNKKLPNITKHAWSAAACWHNF